MKELIEYIAKGIVDDADAVQVTEVRGRAAAILELHVSPEDMGRVIGKQGRIAQSMRTLLKVASVRTGQRAILEIV